MGVTRTRSCKNPLIDAIRWGGLAMSLGMFMLAVWPMGKAAVAHAAGPAAPVYKFKEVVVPGALSTGIVSINNLGVIIGPYINPAGDYHSYFYDGHAFHVIDMPGAVSTSATGINDWGTIVGLFDTADPVTSGTEHGFILRDGQYVQWDFPGASDTDIFGINDLGDVAGAYDLGDIATSLAFLTHRGAPTSFEVPNSLPMSTFATGISNLGQAAGSYADQDGNTRGFVSDGSHFKLIDAGAATNARGVNIRGEVSGTCAGCFSGGRHGFIMTAGHYYPLDVPFPALRTVPWGINDLGVVVGRFEVTPGIFHGFIATPVR